MNVVCWLRQPKSLNSKVSPADGLLGGGYAHNDPRPLPDRRTELKCPAPKYSDPPENTILRFQQSTETIRTCFQCFSSNSVQFCAADALQNYAEQRWNCATTYLDSLESVGLFESKGGPPEVEAEEDTNAKQNRGPEHPTSPTLWNWSR